MSLISTIRSILYGSGKVLGDVNAVQKGKVGKRIVRRVIGKFFGSIFKLIK